MPDNNHNNEKPTPIYSFDGLKNLLRSLGYDVGDAEGYKPIQATDLDAKEIRDNIVMRDDGIFYRDKTGTLRKIFMYKRSYKLNEHGKPRFHIRQCEVISDFIRRGAFRTDYRGANVETVMVRDTDNNDEETEVTGLPLCKYCQKMASNEFPYVITSNQFVQKLKEEGEKQEKNTDTEVDSRGYTKDWATVKLRYLKKIDYTCEKCGIHLRNPFEYPLLKVHHKNGQNADNRDANLICLCPICYADETKKTPSKAEALIITEFGKFILENYLREKDYTCELCGSHVSTRVDYHYMRVHHKNGNVKDNRLSNLQCVCPHCWLTVKPGMFTQQEFDDAQAFIKKYRK